MPTYEHREVRLRRTKRPILIRSPPARSYGLLNQDDRTPGHASNERPDRRSYAVTYRWRLVSITSGGSVGGGGVLSHPVASSQSRTGCLSYDGGVVPGSYVSMSQNLEES